MSAEPICAPSGSGCEPYSGVCGAPPPSGADNGAPCSNDDDCRGDCTPETYAGEATGFIGGQCYSLGRAEMARPGEPVPMSNCPPGSGVVAFNGEQPGDLAPCLAVCDGDSDCRPGYHCDHFEGADPGTPFFTNGVCLPVDCAHGGACPAGYACTMIGASAICTAGMAGDASVDAIGVIDGSDIADDAAPADAATGIDAAIGD